MHTRLSFCLVLLCACVAPSNTGDTETTSESGDTGASGDTGESGATGVTKTIGAPGGIIASADGRVVITVPAGAVDGDTVFAITRVDGAPTSATPAYELEPHGVEFNELVEVTQLYDEGERLIPAVLIDGAWSWLGDYRTDAAARTVSTLRRHFSTYTLVEREDGVEIAEVNELFVSPDGIDSADGLSVATALRTIDEACARVANNRVIVYGGTPTAYFSASSVTIAPGSYTAKANLSCPVSLEGFSRDTTIVSGPQFFAIFIQPHESYRSNQEPLRRTITSLTVNGGVHTGEGCGAQDLLLKPSGGFGYSGGEITDFEIVGAALTEVGADLEARSGTAIATNGTVSGCKTGVRAAGKGQLADLQIMANGTGLALWEFEGTITGSVIRNNVIGVDERDSVSTIATNCEFSCNSDVDLRAYRAVNANNCRWDHTPPLEVSSSAPDANDWYGVVSFAGATLSSSPCVYSPPVVDPPKTACHDQQDEKTVTTSVLGGIYYLSDDPNDACTILRVAPGAVTGPTEVTFSNKALAASPNLPPSVDYEKSREVRVSANPALGATAPSGSVLVEVRGVSGSTGVLAEWTMSTIRGFNQLEASMLPAPSGCTAGTVCVDAADDDPNGLLIVRKPLPAGVLPASENARDALMWSEGGVAYDLGPVFAPSLVQSKAPTCDTPSKQCTPAGDRRMVVLPQGQPCDDVTGADNLDAFSWLCVPLIDGRTVVVAETFKPGKGYKDLIDFNTNEWKDMSLAVGVSGVTAIQTPPGKWYFNPIVPLGPSGPTAGFYTIHVVGNVSEPISAGPLVALVQAPGTTVTTDATTICATATGEFSVQELDVTGPTGANGGICLPTYFGIVRSSSVHGYNFGILASFSTHGWIVDSIVEGSDNGVRVSGATDVHVARTRVFGSSNAAFTLNNSAQGVSITESAAWSSEYGFASGTGPGHFFGNVLAAGTTNFGFSLGHATVLQNAVAALGNTQGIVVTGAGDDVRIERSLATQNRLAGISVAGDRVHFEDSGAFSNGGPGISYSVASGTFGGVLFASANGAVGAACNTASSDCEGPMFPSGCSGALSPSPALSSLRLREGSGVPFATITDPNAFASVFTGYAREGTTLPSCEAIGRCATGEACQVYALHGLNGSPLDRSVALPTGDDVVTITRLVGAGSAFDCLPLSGTTFNGGAGTCETAALKYAIEDDTDFIGNDNGFCESHEVCHFIPHPGIEQRWSKTLSTLPFVDGAIVGVRFREYAGALVAGTSVP